MVNLVVTPVIRAAIVTYTKSTDSNGSSVSPAVQISPDCLFISHSCLVTISKHIKAHDPQYAPSLKTLLRGSSVYLPSKPQPLPKSQEYLQLMNLLRNQQEELEYQRLIHPEKSISSCADLDDTLSPAQEAKVLKEQLSTIVNVIISVASVGFATWYWAGSSAGLSLAVKTLLSLFTSILVLIAEVVIYLRYHVRVSDARAVERAKVEKKSVLTSIEYAPILSDASGQLSEQSIGGGVRRRKP